MTELRLATSGDAEAIDALRGQVFMATLPGLPLYERYGFRVVELVDIALPDGVTMGER